MPRFKTRFTVDGIERKATVTAETQTVAYQKLCSQAAVKFPNTSILVLEVKSESEPNGIPEFLKGFFK